MCLGHSERVEDGRMRLTVVVLVAVSAAWGVGLALAVAVLGVVLGIACMWAVSLLASLFILRHDLPRATPERVEPVVPDAALTPLA